MNIEEFNKKDILGDFEYELNKLCRSCIGTATEIKVKQQPLINLFEEIVWAYEKEKETSHYIQSQLDIANAKLVEEKEKNKELKWKPIKEYDRKKYDWVLVKYFDGDYECVPEVAEKRYDGKWYTSERQIAFEIKYFFDMQQILGEE